MPKIKENAKDLWSRVKSRWSKAVDCSVAFYVVFSCILYFVTGHISEPATALANLVPFIIAMFFVFPLIFEVFLLSREEAKNWMPLKKNLWTAIYVVGLFFCLYTIAPIEAIPHLPLSDWMCREEVGLTVFVTLSVLTILIALTRNDIESHQVR